MASITIDRAKYRNKKDERSWLARFIDDHVKESAEVTKTIKDKEVKTTKSLINADKLFALADANGVALAKIRESVVAGQQGAIGRARMILTGCLKAKLIRGEALVDLDGDPVEVDEDYLASLPIKPAKPVEEAAAA